MSGEDASSSGSGLGGGAAIPYDYNSIMGMDDELWDILEEGDGDLKLDEEGAALDRKAHTAEQKKL